MNDTVTCSRGQTLRMKLTLWEGTRDASPRRDLSDARLFDASIGQSFAAPAISKIDAAQGEVEVLWTDEQTAAMRPGRVHRFRLGIEHAGGEQDVTGDIWINIK